MKKLSIWVVRMVLFGLPHHQIAFKLGLSMEDLRLNFAQELKQANLHTHLHILATLERLAASGRYPSATVSWVKYYCWQPNSKDKSKTEHKSSNNNNQQQDEEPWGTHEPGDIVVYGPNGETK